MFCPICLTCLVGETKSGNFCLVCKTDGVFSSEYSEYSESS